MNGADGLVNLAGRSVACIKTPDRHDEILRSRVESTRALGEALRSIAAPPPTWVQMSTAHIYGDPPKSICTEESALGYGRYVISKRLNEAGFEFEFPRLPEALHELIGRRARAA